MKLNSFFFLLPLLISLFSIYPTIANLNVDKQALLNFAATVPHARKLNWAYKTRICTSWVGVSCDPNNSRVTSLRLPGVGFKGPIPSNILQRLDALSILSLRANRFTGDVPSDLLSLPSLRYIYLQNNNFSGNIPSNISSQLNALDLSFNSFTGSIPNTIQNLTSLASLNLENNALTGPIPDLDIPTLKQLNLSNNNLNGSIPPSLRRFPSSSFQGNRLLISPSPSPSPSTSPSPSPSTSPSPSPLFSPSLSPTRSPSPSPSLIYLPPPRLASPPRASQSKRQAKTSLSTGAISAIAFGGLAMLFFPLLIAVFCFFKRKKPVNGDMAKGNAYMAGGRSETPREDFSSGAQVAAENNKLVFFEGLNFNFDLEDLLRASAEVMGKGNYGTSYRALLEDGTTILVKRLKELVVGKREFELQMEIMGRINHPNVLPLRAYYYSKDEKLLVYDHMLFGSFSSQLHGNRQNGRTLNWVSRVKICLGAAKGIAHIHSINGSKSAHGNIKSSNILLTQNLDALVSDHGLTTLMGTPTIPPRTTGYQAPEVIETRKFTQKSDVYSFGVLLLEALTGKSPLPIPGLDDVADLPKWVLSVVREEWTAEVFDAELVKFHDIEEEMVQMLQIGMACVERVPAMRPTMDDVVKMIEDIRVSDSENKHSYDDDNTAQTP